MSGHVYLKPRPAAMQEVEFIAFLLHPEYHATAGADALRPGLRYAAPRSALGSLSSVALSSAQASRSVSAMDGNVNTRQSKTAATRPVTMPRTAIYQPGTAIEWTPTRRPRSVTHVPGLSVTYVPGRSRGARLTPR